jgi:two-component system, NarL family, response regulator LiaR
MSLMASPFRDAAHSFRHGAVAAGARRISMERRVLKRQIVLYGLGAGALIALLKLVDYHYLMLSHSVEMYGAVVAAIFAGLGIWLGNRLTGARGGTVVREVVREVVVQEVVREVESPVPASVAGGFVVDPARREAFGITRREHEILELIAAGLSNKEIAGRIFVSENTVKTHSSRLFEKLGARRRTQAVQLAKERGLIP